MPTSARLPRQHQPSTRCLPSGVLTHDLRVVALRELVPGEHTLEIACNRAEVAAPDVRRHVMRREPFSRVISFGVGVTMDISDTLQRHDPAAGQRYLQVAHRIEIAPDFGLAPDDDVEELLILGELADLRAADNRGGGAAHLDPASRRRRQPFSGRNCTSTCGTITCACTVRSATP